MAAVQPVRAVPVFLACTTAVSLYTFVLRPQLGKNQLERIKQTRSGEVSVSAQ